MAEPRADLATRWQPGQSGNPKGGKPNECKAAIRRILAEPSGIQRLTHLENLIEILLARSGAGDVSAIRELLDRGYGKPAQAEEDREAAAAVGEAATGMLLAVLGVKAGE